MEMAEAQEIEVDSVVMVSQVKGGSKFHKESELIDKVAMCKNAHFKSQQIGEADLTLDEKREIVRDVLNKGPTPFLRRFYQHLDEDDSKYFEQYKNDYEVNFYLKDIRDRSHSKGASKVVKNRRYAALQAFIKEGKYFCDHEMRKRDPRMFEQFVGQYMSRSEKEEMDLSAKRDESDLMLSNVLMDRIADQQKEEEFIEEFDSDSEEEQSDKDEKTAILSDYERLLLKNEFVTNMHRNFLEGRDTDFDYSLVDENTDYDALELVQQDAEDRYFDSEESELESKF